MAFTNVPLFLSIVVPAYNEELRIKQCIQSIRAFFDRLGPQWEALIVIEKSDDRTSEIAKLAKEGDPRITIIENSDHFGKGYAVKTGMLQAKGKYIIYMDADLSTPLVEVFNFLYEAEASAEIDILIGNRKHPKSKIIKKQSLFRQKAGEFFNFMVQLIVFRGIKDTQCGFKLFKAHTVKPLFEHLKTNGFAFDVEVLLKAKKLEYHVKSMPVQWINSSHSKVSFFKDSLRMLLEIIYIKFSS